MYSCLLGVDCRYGYGMVHESGYMGYASMRLYIFFLYSGKSPQAILVIIPSTTCHESSNLRTAFADLYIIEAVDKR